MQVILEEGEWRRVPYWSPGDGEVDCLGADWTRYTWDRMKFLFIQENRSGISKYRYSYIVGKGTFTLAAPGHLFLEALYRSFCIAFRPLALLTPTKGQKWVKKCRCSIALPAFRRHCPFISIVYTTPTVPQRCCFEDFFKRPASAPLQCESNRAFTLE